MSPSGKPRPGCHVGFCLNLDGWLVNGRNDAQPAAPALNPPQPNPHHPPPPLPPPLLPRAVTSLPSPTPPSSGTRSAQQSSCASRWACDFHYNGFCVRAAAHLSLAGQCPLSPLRRTAVPGHSPAADYQRHAMPALSCAALPCRTCCARQPTSCIKSKPTSRPWASLVRMACLPRR